MKQVLVSMRPKDGDALSRLDRTGTGAGTSSAGEKPPRRGSRGGGEEDWGRRGRATVFVSVRRVEGWRPWTSDAEQLHQQQKLSSPHLLTTVLLLSRQRRAEARGQQLFCPCGASELSSGIAGAFIVKGGSGSRCSARQQRCLPQKFLPPGSALLQGVCLWLSPHGSAGWKMALAPDKHQRRKRSPRDAPAEASSALNRAAAGIPPPFLPLSCSSEDSWSGVHVSPPLLFSFLTDLPSFLLMKHNSSERSW